MKASFFIVGSPRSGTTLLVRMLNGHSQIAVTPETHFGALYSKWRARLEVDSDLRSGPRGREAFLDTFCASKQFAALRIDESAFRDAASARPEDPWWPLRVGMEAFGRLNGKGCIGEKTPSHALHVDSLASAFPTARFLMIWRDPRAVSASMAEVEQSNRNPTEAAAIWRRYSKAMRRSRAKLPGRCLEVRYEALVAEPEQELSRICSFLDLPYEAALLDYPERPYKKGGWQTDQTGLLPQVGRIEAWRTSLTSEQVSHVEMASGREMSRMGYVPEASALERVSAELRIGPALRLKRMAKAVKKNRFWRSNA